MSRRSLTNYGVAGAVALAVPVVLVAVTALSGCSGHGRSHEGAQSGSPGTLGKPVTASAAPRIVLITNGFAAFWDSMDKGRQAAASKLHVETEWAGPPHSQAAEQKNLMEEYADKGFNCMAVSCVEASTIGPVIDNLMNRGVKVITFDSDAPNSKRLIYIGTDNYQSGIVAGQQMVKLLPQGGDVWGFVGNISAENARDRRDGFLKAVQGHKIKLVDVLEDQKDAEIARQNVDNILQSKRSQVAGLVGFYSYDTPQIAEAVNQAGLRSKIKIVGFDAEPGTLTALRSGGVDATVVQKPYEFGKLAVEFLALAQKDGPAKAKQEWNGLHSNYPLKNDIINTGVQVVTPANIGPFMQQLKKWGVASS